MQNMIGEDVVISLMTSSLNLNFAYLKNLTNLEIIHGCTIAPAAGLSATNFQNVNCQIKH